ncbi:MAG TPA: triose-phosphate isomerase [Mycobacteriales bacterium]|jgi:triosephosphate isomerase|nr:triose-phosphate isomerase [Mycobacteriales bacterium]
MSGARRPLVAGNWKMHLTHLEAIAHTQKIAYSLKPEHTDAVETVVLPAFTALRSVQTLIDGDKLALGYGAQDLAVASSGAHTGDVSGPMLAALGCGYVCVGHSERRADHAETDEVVAAKVRAAYEHGIVPILCVGETLETRESGQHVDHVVAQLSAATAGIADSDAEVLVVAYEPVWAIGTGRTATPEDAQEMAAALRAQLAAQFSAAIAGAVRILYGGSVKAGNASDIFDEPDVDGGLIGGASLVADDFVAIVRAAGAS